ncbi:hypothetical protein LEN26_004284 [Aphanomyces euteiches]|nr:hypothetical protein AeMF1_011272 [Aphanomyces euteiches]KAH9149336.1 hypothetical protein LEN26_004284 [Aphanomyces euteiches]KAH9188828.1 hypothetical protein AeNC1_009193 [Aphanomyces euteiches]
MKVSRVSVFAISWMITFLTSGGLSSGFGPVYSRLVEEKQWSELCPGANATSAVCSAQEVQLQSVYTTATLMTALGQTLFGVLLDIIGPCCYHSTLCSFPSLVTCLWRMEIRTTPGTDSLIVAGYALITFGGMGVLVSTIQLSYLFPEPSVYMSLLVSAFRCSGYIYIFLELDISRQAFFVGYSVLVVLCMLIVFLVFPVRHVTEECMTTTIPGFSVEKPQAKTTLMSNIWAGLKEQTKTRGDLWVVTGIGSFLFLQIVYTGGAIPSILTSLTHGDAKLNDLYVNYLYPFVSGSWFLIAPVAGFLLQHHGFKKTSYITLWIFVAFCATLMLPNLAIQNLSFVLLSLANGFLNCLLFHRQDFTWGIM